MTYTNCHIHRLIFENNLEKLRHVFEQEKDGSKIIGLLNEQDKHGNTPLHLACILGCTESIKLLVANQASCRSNNKYRCSPLHESISFGNRENLHYIFLNFVNESKSIFSRELVEQCIRNLPDCKFTVNWKFKTWIPLISNLLPGDICTIWKKGPCVRVDTTIPDIETYLKSFWKKKETISILIDSSRDPYGPFFLDHSNKTFKNISDFADANISPNELNAMLCTEICAMRFNLKDAKIQPELSGIWQKEQKIKIIDRYTCKCIQVSNIEAQIIMRTEHMNEEIKNHLNGFRSQFANDIKANKDNLSIKDEMKKFEESLEQLLDKRCATKQPERIIPKVTFDEYQEASDCFKILGRDMNIQVIRKTLQLDAALANDFYLKPDDLINVLEYIVTLKQFKRLQEFAKLVSPFGFPMQIEIPIYPAIKAVVTLSDFVFDSSTIDNKLFKIPDTYVEKIKTSK
ncbi:hypothetical protein GJ496_006761 [Pomphorhynchus laevis]|nr:hypothetical protein GJ496_006761 [Pomphorhynchus laevis]